MSNNTSTPDSSAVHSLIALNGLGIDGAYDVNTEDLFEKYSPIVNPTLEKSQSNSNSENCLGRHTPDTPYVKDSNTSPYSENPFVGNSPTTLPEAKPSPSSPYITNLFGRYSPLNIPVVEVPIPSSESDCSSDREDQFDCQPLDETEHQFSQVRFKPIHLAPPHLYNFKECSKKKKKQKHAQEVVDANLSTPDSPSSVPGECIADENCLSAKRSPRNSVQTSTIMDASDDDLDQQCSNDIIIDSNDAIQPDCDQNLLYDEETPVPREPSRLLCTPLGKSSPSYTSNGSTPLLATDNDKTLRMGDVQYQRDDTLRGVPSNRASQVDLLTEDNLIELPDFCGGIANDDCDSNHENLGNSGRGNARGKNNRGSKKNRGRGGQRGKGNNHNKNKGFNQNSDNAAHCDSEGGNKSSEPTGVNEPFITKEHVNTKEHVHTKDPSCQLSGYDKFTTREQIHALESQCALGNSRCHPAVNKTENFKHAWNQMRR